MPRVIAESRREELKLRMLKLLGVNGRMSIGNLGKQLQITKPSAYHLFLEVVKEYDLKFLPEIDISKIWRYEFIKMSRMRTKKEILDEAIEEIPEAGFEEYVVLFKFIGKKPSDVEIKKAIGDTYIPQFVARLQGKHDMVMYAVARNYSEINSFIVRFSRNLKISMVSELNKAETGFGFFPLRNALLEKFNISETYLALLLGLNENGRQEFINIARKYKKEQQGMVYAMDRLRRTGILKRITYYEGATKNTASYIVQIKITNYEKWMKKRDSWHIGWVNGYSKSHNEYIYECDISNPQGVLIFAAFKNAEGIKRLIRTLKKDTAGAEIGYTKINGTILGTIGVRDFDMRYSSVYHFLETNRKVPRFDREGVEEIEDGASAPDAEIRY